MDILANNPSLHEVLPLIFMALLGIAMLVYVILDGYDLGIGMLMLAAQKKQRDIMISSIAPFWDANETWLVLGIGIMLVAFPIAYGIVLTALYIPVAIMLAGLILRGVAFDFRSKSQPHQKDLWDKVFITGSIIASLAQGYMLGLYIMGLKLRPADHCFALLIAFCLAASYCFIGSCWLIMKAEGELQRYSINAARIALIIASLGMLLISITTPLISERIFNRWFSLPNFFFLLPIPVMTGATVLFLFFFLKNMPYTNDRYCWVPFVGAVTILTLCFHGLAYSFYPYIIPEQLTITETASAPESLLIILAGVLVVLPCIIGYTIFSYYIFRSKVKELHY